MADDEHEPDDDGEDTYGDYLEEQRRTFPHVMPDALLAGLVADVNRQGASGIGLTLFVGGTLLSGDLVAANAWMQLVADHIEASAGEGGAVLTTFFREHGVEGTLAVASEAIEGTGMFGSPTAIHLANTTVFNGGVALLNSSLWRGRLSHVDAWVMGRVQIS